MHSALSPRTRGARVGAAAVSHVERGHHRREPCLARFARMVVGVRVRPGQIVPDRSHLTNPDLGLFGCSHAFVSCDGTVFSV